MAPGLENGLNRCSASIEPERTEELTPVPDVTGPVGYEHLCISV